MPPGSRSVVGPATASPARHRGPAPGGAARCSIGAPEHVHDVARCQDHTQPALRHHVIHRAHRAQKGGERHARAPRLARAAGRRCGGGEAAHARDDGVVVPARGIPVRSGTGSRGGRHDPFRHRPGCSPLWRTDRPRLRGGRPAGGKLRPRARSAERRNKPRRGTFPDRPRTARMSSAPSPRGRAKRRHKHGCGRRRHEPHRC